MYQTIRTCFALAAVVASAGCADLETMQHGICGNGVVEAALGEDCDLFPSASCRQPGTEGECRFDCSSVDCPAGYACGSDDLCRRPTGQFTKAPPVEIGSARVAAADFDGDDLSDLAVTAFNTVHVHYAETTGGFGPVFEMPVDIGVPAIGQLTSGQLADVVVSVQGMMVFRGQSDRTFDPTVYASYALPFVAAQVAIIDAVPEYLECFEDPLPPEGPDMPNACEFFYSGHEMLLLADDEMRFVEAAGLGQLGMLSHSVADLSGPPQVGNVIDDLVQSPCEDLVWAYTDATEVLVHSPCRHVGDTIYEWNSFVDEKEELTRVKLPPTVEVQGRIVVGDADLDGHLDLFIEAAETGETLCSSFTFVAYNDGSGMGLFDPHPPLGTPDPPEDPDAVCLENKQLGARLTTPLAVGDLNGDGRIDLVTSGALFVSTDDGPIAPFVDITYRTVELHGDYFEFAHVADFNQNGTLDVIGGNYENTQLTFFNGVGDGTFNEFKIPLGGIPRGSSVGDFDGDLLPDLVFGEESSDDLGDSLMVSFGDAHGPPLTPVPMGRLGTIEQTSAGAMSVVDYDGMDEVAVVTTSDSGDVGLAVLLGSSSQQLSAPFRFSVDPVDDPVGTEQPEVFALGQFADDEHLDLAVLTRSQVSYDAPPPLEEEYGDGRGGPGMDSFGTPYLWLLPSTGEAALDAGKNTFVQLPDELGSALGLPLLAPVDLDGDGTDELLLLGSHSDENSLLRRGTLVVARANDGEWKLESAQDLEQGFGRDPYGPWGCYGFTQPATGGGRGAAGGEVGDEGYYGCVVYDGQVDVVDFDGDGRQDVVALAYVEQGDASWAVGQNQLVLFHNDGSGTLGKAQQIIFDSPFAEEQPSGFAVLNADHDPAPELLVLSPTRGVLADVDLAQGKLVNVRDVPQSHGGHGATAADFDGDGVLDLAVATDARIDVLLGQSE